MQEQINPNDRIQTILKAYQAISGDMAKESLLTTLDRLSKLFRENGEFLEGFDRIGGVHCISLITTARHLPFLNDGIVFSVLTDVNKYLLQVALLAAPLPTNREEPSQVLVAKSARSIRSSTKSDRPLGRSDTLRARLADNLLKLISIALINPDDPQQDSRSMRLALQSAFQTITELETVFHKADLNCQPLKGVVSKLLTASESSALSVRECCGILQSNVSDFLQMNQAKLSSAIKLEEMFFAPKSGADALPYLLEVQKDLKSQTTLPNQRVVKERVAVHGKELGRGGYGCVYRLDKKFMLSMVVKVAMEEDVRDLRRESEHLSRLSHPHIMQAFAMVSYKSGDLGMMMEFAEQGSLLQHLQSNPALPMNTRLEYVLDIAKAVEYLHGMEILHRDIKSENVLVTLNGAKLADFGLSIPVSEALQDTRPGTIKAPEYYQSDESTKATDIFAMGVVALVTITGQGLDQEKSYGAKIARGEEVNFPREAGEQVPRTVSKDPSQRPSAGEVRESIQRQIIPRCFMEKMTEAREEKENVVNEDQSIGADESRSKTTPH